MRAGRWWCWNEDQAHCRTAGGGGGRVGGLYPAPEGAGPRPCGVLLEEIDLSRVDEPYSLTLEDESGRNVLSVERGRVCVSEADCPDQVCVKQGWVSSGAAPIVCLPHKLVVELAGTGEDLDGGAG